ncbi:hypothetical protein C2G38_2238640 [Gigaspora rosea]|uniref:Uncharacterized protein n=1 Tax=Gigaspora rosea TaxID=44941 RepID=A0A397W791_9GLOM|nr:hypothetical protein C2G38_2238640 [Gigaspora rosea]
MIQKKSSKSIKNMNWTGSKRNKTKVKLEQQRQREFFDRQRLKKVHKFLKIEPKSKRTLPNIEVVRQIYQNDDSHQPNSLLEESNRSNNCDDQRSSPNSLDLNHFKVHAEIFCKDKNSTSHEPDSKLIKLDHKKTIDSTTASQSMTDILKRKQDLLQGFDWVGVSISSSINVTNTNDATSSEKNRRSRSRSVSRQYSKEAFTSTHFRRSDSPSLSTKLSKKSMHETTTVVDVATIIDSMAPLEQTITSEREDSIEWHHFLSVNDECTSKITDSPPPIYADTDSKILETNKSPISTSRTIETSALHSIIPQSVTSTNVAWNNFLRNSDVTSNVDFDDDDDDDDEKLEINSSIIAINSSKLSSKKKIITNKKNKKSNFNEFVKNFNDNEDNLDYIRDEQLEQLNYNQDVIIDQNVLNRIHNLEMKNAHLQLELNFLKQDMKYLMDATKNNDNEIWNKLHSSNIIMQMDELKQTSVANIELSMNQDKSIKFYKADQNLSQAACIEECIQNTTSNLKCKPPVNEQNHFVNDPSPVKISKDLTNVTHSSSDHVKMFTKNIQSSVQLTPINNNTLELMSVESPTLRLSTNFNHWETLPEPEMINSDMYLFDALDDDEEHQKCLEIPKN